MAQGVASTFFSQAPDMPRETAWAARRRLLMGCGLALVFMLVLAELALILLIGAPATPKPVQPIRVLLEEKAEPEAPPDITPDTAPTIESGDVTKEATTPVAPEAPAEEKEVAVTSVTTPTSDDARVPTRSEWLGYLDFADEWAEPTEDFRTLNGPPAGLEAAKERYYAAELTDPPIWGNVEEDQMGRKILRSGDCYRVIEDNNPMRIDIFETFTRHLVFCEK